MKKKNLNRRGLILDPDHPRYKDATWTITFGPRLNFKTQSELPYCFRFLICNSACFCC